MALTGIQSVSVYVSDVDKALDFYMNKLGFEKHMDAPIGPDTDLRWVTVAPPGSPTELVLVKGYAEWSPERVGKFAGFVYNVEDIEGTFAEFKAKGVDIIEEPISSPGALKASSKTRTATAS